MLPPASVDELFAIAIAMEDLANDFYQTLAPVCHNHEVSHLCRVLARQERQHRELFLTMRCLAVRSTGDSDAPAAGLDMEVIEDVIQRQILPPPEVVQKVALTGGLFNALDLAIRMEEDAIAFYGRIAAILPALAGDIDVLVQAERDHLRQLRDAQRRFPDLCLGA